ncbi:MAG TPA: hypothetical protein VHE12_03505 [bacterium]|nr:hypothetical protein [bacterium]
MEKRTWRGAALGVLALTTVGQARAGNEWVTFPLVAADYYGWAYTESSLDHADIYTWSTAGVDALGWGLFLAAKDYDAGLFLVNAAGDAKTLYPVATLLWAPEPPVRERAWIALGTHTATLLALELLGRPALSIQTTQGPHRDGMGLSYAFRF